MFVFTSQWKRQTTQLYDNWQLWWSILTYKPDRVTRCNKYKTYTDTPAVPCLPSSSICIRLRSSRKPLTDAWRRLSVPMGVLWWITMGNQIARQENETSETPPPKKLPWTKTSRVCCYCLGTHHQTAISIYLKHIGWCLCHIDFRGLINTYHIFQDASLTSTSRNLNLEAHSDRNTSPSVVCIFAARPNRDLPKEKWQLRSGWNPLSYLSRYIKKNTQSIVLENWCLLHPDFK